jgi:Ca-activated chloride channel family protein
MWTKRSVVCAVVAVSLLAAPAIAQKIKSSTTTVALYATVIDDEKRLVPGLEREDFEVYDNGKLQDISLFDNKVTPITVIVMLDTSGSMTSSLDRVKEAAEQFLIRLLPQDKGKVGAFSDKIDFYPKFEFIGDRDRLVRELGNLDFGYPTRLWDAANQSIAQLEEIDGRKVLLLFTDGEDTSSQLDRGEVVRRARDKDVMVYSIGLENIYFNGQSRQKTNPDRGLKSLADETGGGYFLLKKTDELGPAFTRIAQELHSQYVLGFSPAALDGKVHKLDVKIKKPGMVPRARKSYLAVPQASTAGGR